jgi:hypothetical protein
LAISAESIARAIAYAVEQPADIDINERQQSDRGVRGGVSRDEERFGEIEWMNNVLDFNQHSS